VRAKSAPRVSLYLFISTLAFGSGWFSLSFAIPLLAQNIGYSYVVIGILGFVASLPFPVVALIYLKSGYRMLRYGTIIPLLSLTVLSLFFYFFYRTYFIPLTIIASVIQAPWWIATEISLGTFDGSRNAEKYSAGWGIPNALAPILMGVILQISGYEIVFLISMVAFIIGALTSPRPGKLDTYSEQKPVKRIFLLSLFFAGLFSGFIYFVIEPVLRAHGISYILIGGIISLYGVVAAIGYILLNYTKDWKISTYSAISAILIVPTALIGIMLNIYTVIIAVILAGFGVSVSMSKVLSYIASSSDVKRGVFFYETFFGTGFMVGSLLQDVLYQYVGKVTIFILFLTPLAYAISLLIIRPR
jgi:hypothetical protein